MLNELNRINLTGVSVRADGAQNVEWQYLAYGFGPNTNAEKLHLDKIEIYSLQQSGTE